MDMEESTKVRMNLVAIQKVDPYAREIIDSCPHVAYYKYAANEWQKSEIEGSFFVYSRVAEPFHSIFINNRLNTNSLVEPLTKPFEIQSQPPFLLYRNMRAAISGFWFYCKEDCIRIYELMEKLKKNCNHNAPKSEHVPAQHPTAFHNVNNNNCNNNNGSNPNNGQSKKDVDIFSMLSKAQAEFNNCGMSPGATLEDKLLDLKINRNPVIQKHAALVKAVSKTLPDITSPNVMSFFVAANNVIVPSVSTKEPGVSSQYPMTVDELEKQQRVTSKSPKVVTEQNLLNNLLQSAGNAQQQSASPQTIHLLQQQSGSTPNVQASSKPTLITPTMFQASNIEEKAILGVQQQSTNNAATPGVSNIRPEPLTQNQLIQALNYLLENDPDFIRKIHEAYIKSFNKIISL